MIYIQPFAFMGSMAGRNWHSFVGSQPGTQKINALADGVGGQPSGLHIADPGRQVSRAGFFEKSEIVALCGNAGAGGVGVHAPSRKWMMKFVRFISAL